VESHVPRITLTCLQTSGALFSVVSPTGSPGAHLMMTSGYSMLGFDAFGPSHAFLIHRPCCWPWRRMGIALADHDRFRPESRASSPDFCSQATEGYLLHPSSTAWLNTIGWRACSGRALPVLVLSSAGSSGIAGLEAERGRGKHCHSMRSIAHRIYVSG